MGTAPSAIESPRGPARGEVIPTLMCPCPALSGSASRRGLPPQRPAPASRRAVRRGGVARAGTSGSADEGECVAWSTSGPRRTLLTSSSASPASVSSRRRGVVAVQACRRPPATDHVRDRPDRTRPQEPADHTLATSPRRASGLADDLSPRALRRGGLEPCSPKPGTGTVGVTTNPRSSKALPMARPTTSRCANLARAASDVGERSSPSRRRRALGLRRPREHYDSSDTVDWLVPIDVDPRMRTPHRPVSEAMRSGGSSPAEPYLKIPPRSPVCGLTPTLRWASSGTSL